MHLIRDATSLVVLFIVPEFDIEPEAGLQFDGLENSCLESLPACTRAGRCLSGLRLLESRELGVRTLLDASR